MNLTLLAKTVTFQKIRPNRRLFLIRIIAVFLLYILKANGETSAQTIDLRTTSAPLKEIIGEIKKQTGMHVIYLKDLMQQTKPVTVDLENTPLPKALEQIFSNQPIQYEIQENTIVLSPLNTTTTPSESKLQQQVITGLVTDTAGNSLKGVTISLKDKTSTATSTDDSGNYMIAVPGAGSLIFSYTGFRSMEIPIENRAEINVTLVPVTDNLEEVVVVGYGEQKKESVVSSVSSVGSEKITFPTRNLSNNLSGQLAGLLSIQRTGEPGRDASEFWIRGISTFAGNSATQPLILVDGVPRAFDNIEPDEIETFSILKDAAATAVYGAEGANGVILVTTKRGLVAKPYISFRTEQSFSSPTRLPEFVDSWQYLELANEALTNDGLAPLFTEEQINKYREGTDRDLYPNANWMDELLSDVTTNQRYTLNFRGGVEKARYFVSGAYFSEKGIFKNDPLERYQTNIGLQRYNLRSNVDINVTESTELSVDLSGQYLQRNQAGVNATDIFSLMLNTPSYIFPAVYSDGTIATYPVESDSNNRNPYNQLMNSGYQRSWNSLIQSTVGLTQKLNFITSGLSFNGKASFDYDGTFGSARGYNPSRYYATGRDDDGNLIFSQTISGSPDMSAPNESSSANKKIYLESSLRYDRDFNNKHRVGAMLLYMQKETQFHNEALAFRKQGIVGRSTYSYDDRYFLEGNFGYTGSETFAKGHRFGFFPAVGVGYMISNEHFYPEKLKKYVSMLKIRASAGRTGNDNTGAARFLYRPVYDMDGSGFDQGITNGGGSNGLGSGIHDLQFENTNLLWELEDKFNLGMDVNLLITEYKSWRIIFDRIVVEFFCRDGPYPDRRVFGRLLGTTMERFKIEGLMAVSMRFIKSVSLP